MRLETYGKRRVWKNPFKKRSGWLIMNMARSYVSLLRKLEGY